MEEKKLDINSIIGFVLIFGILIFMFYTNKPTPEERERQISTTPYELIEALCFPAIPSSTCALLQM